MMLSKDLRTLIKSHRLNRLKCVGFARCGNVILFALNGFEKDKDAIQIIQNLYGEDAVCCKHSSSLTFIDPFAEPDYYLQNSLIKNFSNFNINTLVYPFNLVKKEFKWDNYLQKNTANRHWSCVERKIIGYSKYESRTIGDIFVDMMPCALCLPTISRAYYIKSSSLYKLDGIVNYSFKKSMPYCIIHKEKLKNLKMGWSWNEDRIVCSYYLKHIGTNNIDSGKIREKLMRYGSPRKIEEINERIDLFKKIYAGNYKRIPKQCTKVFDFCCNIDHTINKQ